MSEVQVLAQRLRMFTYIVLMLVIAIIILAALYVIMYTNYVNLVHHYVALLKACNTTAIHLPTTP